MIISIVVALMIFFYGLPMAFKFLSAFTEIFGIKGLLVLAFLSTLLWMFFG